MLTEKMEFARKLVMDMAIMIENGTNDYPAVMAKITDIKALLM